MRAGRLLSILLLLQNRGRMTAGELAAELEVSVRTVYRDVDALSEAGVPVYADRGRAGGFQLVGGYRTRLTGLNEDEARSLALAGLPDAAAELGLGTVLGAAQLKLYAALPEELRAGAGRVAERFFLDVPGWHREVERLAHLTDVADAVWRARRLRVDYRRWDGSAVSRTLEPLGLVLKAGAWYLVARCDGSDRTYRVSRIVAMTDEGEFARPAGFDLAEYWRTWSEGFARRLYPGTATVRLSPLGRRLVPVYLGSVGAAALEEADRAGAAEADEDGWCTVRLPVEAGRPGVGELLRFGPDLEVLEPDELRAAVAEAVTTTAARYTR